MPQEIRFLFALTPTSVVSDEGNITDEVEKPTLQPTHPERSAVEDPCISPRAPQPTRVVAIL